MILIRLSLEAIVRYDPTTYKGKSPKYEGIWDVLKQQALLVTFIRDLVLARGQLILAPRFLNFIEIVKTRKSAPDYKCTRQEECVLLTKSWVSFNNYRYMYKIHVQDDWGTKDFFGTLFSLLYRLF